MTPEQAARFLYGPHIAHVVTQRADGSSHVVPVWYAFVDETFAIFTPGTSVKVKNLARDPRLTISIASSDRPYRYVVANGLATVTAMAGANDDVYVRAQSIAARYEGGPDGGRAYMDKLLTRFPVSLITMAPTAMRQWTSER